MNSKIIKARKNWVKALRSGQYKKDAGMLKSDRGFCCLGVACDISGLGVWCDNYSYKIDEEERGGYLLSKVVEQLGLECDDPQVNGVFLSRLNDEGKTFAYIADLIKDKLINPYVTKTVLLRDSKGRFAKK